MGLKELRICMKAFQKVLIKPGLLKKSYVQRWSNICMEEAGSNLKKYYISLQVNFEESQRTMPRLDKSQNCG